MSVILLPWMWNWKPGPSAMCVSVWPIVRLSFAGLKLYFSSGISSAIFTVLSRTVRNAAAISLPP